MKKEPEVSVICCAYNHSAFIRETLDGFVKQKTSFPFEVLIHDDASTDGTKEIIHDYERRFPEIVKGIYQTENQYSKGIPIGDTFIIPKARGKYFAHCEGDDYWIDEFKLQKQYDAMEAYPDIDMCAHAAIKLSGKKGSLWSPKNKRCILTTEEVILGGGGYLATNSLFYRSKMRERIPEFYKFLRIDYTLQIWGSLRGGILFLPDCMSVYRFRTPGSWTARMDLDVEKMKAHIEKANQMLEILDQETKGAYEKSIAKHIHENKMHIIGLLGKNHLYDAIKSGPYKAVYDDLPINRKLKITIKQLLYSFMKSN